MRSHRNTLLGFQAIFTVPLMICSLFAVMAPLQSQTREEKVRADQLKFETDGFWIYNNFEKGITQAKQSNKPLLVVMRCVPCVECVKLDDDLVESHPRLQLLLKQFVRVRLISTNGLDLSLFQFDTDQSFNVFMFNADGTIYGRYGTRSDREHWEDDVSVEGMANALQGAIELHADYPNNREVLKGKRGPAPLFPTPEKFPNLASKYGPTLDYTGNVVKSCIHCHQIGDAIKQYHRGTNIDLPDNVLFPYPHPKAIGLILDPTARATVKTVEQNSAAARAGFQSGDRIETMNGQPLLSIADVQWVLHHIPASGGTVDAQVVREGAKKTIQLRLDDQWKAKDDIAWRASTWSLRQMGLGGMFLKPATDTELQEVAFSKKDAGITESQTILRIQHVGQFAPHDAAKRAGFIKNDVVTKIDGRTDFHRETDILAYVLKNKKPGDTIPFEVYRDNKKMGLTLTVPTLSAADR